MAGNGSGDQPVLVVVQLEGGNDFMNTIVPYTSPIYYDNRPNVNVPQEQVLPINDILGFHPSLGPLKELYDQGQVAVVQGIGYPNPNRSHFRSMDIWHTCNPDKIVAEGWLGKAIGAIDPHKENVVTGINFGRGLPRALACPGVLACSVGNLDAYGIMSSIVEEERRNDALKNFKDMYGPAIGTGPVMDYLAETSVGVLEGADILKNVPDMYTSSVEYADNTIARGLRDVARVHVADLGTRVFYAHQGGYDTHAQENAHQPKLLSELSAAIMDFFQDLRDHNASENVAMLVFTEFGRRVAENGSGTDHGAGGGAFIIGERVNGGLHAEYPSLEPGRLSNDEDLEHTIDFRGVYATLLEQWMGVEAAPIVGGNFEQLRVFSS